MTRADVPTLTYDANGNLQSDGTNTCTWDTRNPVSGITGGVTASFSYDPFGRRTTSTINGATTQYLYDHQNVIQEDVGAGASTANLLTGLALDDAYLAVAVLAGLVLNVPAGWWWADPLAGFVIVLYGAREGWAAFHRPQGV